MVFRFVLVLGEEDDHRFESNMTTVRASDIPQLLIVHAQNWFLSSYNTNTSTNSSTNSKPSPVNQGIRLHLSVTNTHTSLTRSTNPAQANVIKYASRGTRRPEK